MTESQRGPTGRWRLPDHVLWETVEVESVLLDLESGLYYSLNETGTAMLARLAEGASVDEVAASLSSVYSVGQDTVRHDTVSFARRLASLGILVPRLDPELAP